MQGRIIKGIAGFYYIQGENQKLYECKAKGIFRKEKTKPLVGDLVQLEILDEEHGIGNIQRIIERKNTLVRPAVANVDQALVIFAITKPEPNLNLLDRFLVTMEEQEISCIICFNKCDLTQKEKIDELKNIYQPAGYELHFISAKEKEGIDGVRDALLEKVTTVAGPSGVGKSSLINCLQKQICMETGNISEKIERGKHTTRHAQLIEIAKDSYIVDTPGFSSLSVEYMDAERIKALYPEFQEFEAMCKFAGCSHIHEPVCGVKNGVAEEKISEIRYRNYMQIYEECKNKRRY